MHGGGCKDVKCYLIPSNHQTPSILNKLCTLQFHQKPWMPYWADSLVQTNLCLLPSNVRLSHWETLFNWHMSPSILPVATSGYFSFVNCWRQLPPSRLLFFCGIRRAWGPQRCARLPRWIEVRTQNRHIRESCKWHIICKCHQCIASKMLFLLIKLLHFLMLNA